MRVRRSEGSLGVAVRDPAARGSVSPGRDAGRVSKPELHQRAVDLRQGGWSYSQIVRELGVSKGSCSAWLAGIPTSPAQVPEELSEVELGGLREALRAGPGAAATRELVEILRGASSGEVPLPAELDDRREVVRWLRASGWSQLEINRKLGVPTSTASDWCRDIIVLPGNVVTAPGPVRSLTCARREERRARDKRAAADVVGELTDREVILTAVVAYWCEGSKDKPYDRREWLSFVNSDPGLIRLWMRFLDLMDVAPARRRLRVLIHETGDLVASTAFWSEVAGIPEVEFGRPTIKRHRPKTNRRNVGTDYHGCLCVTVAGSARLYRIVEGLASGVLSRCGPAEPRA